MAAYRVGYRGFTLILVSIAICLHLFVKVSGLRVEILARCCYGYLLFVVTVYVFVRPSRSMTLNILCN